MSITSEVLGDLLPSFKVYPITSIMRAHQKSMLRKYIVMRYRESEKDTSSLSIQIATLRFELIKLAEHLERVTYRDRDAVASLYRVKASLLMRYKLAKKQHKHELFYLLATDQYLTESRYPEYFDLCASLSEIEESFKPGVLLQIRRRPRLIILSKHC